MVTFSSNYWTPALDVKLRRRPAEADKEISPKIIKDKSTFAPPVVNNVFSSSLTEQDTESDLSDPLEIISTPPSQTTAKRQPSYKRYFNKDSGTQSPSEHDFLNGVKNTWKDMLSIKGSKLGSTSSKNGKKTDEQSFSQKYGTCEKKTIGKGATAVVRIAHKSDIAKCETLYAIKEFRKRRKEETEKEYVKKLTSEFCISSTLKHINIVDTVDLIKDENGHWCEVMEYCPGGDLYSIIKNGNMGTLEMDCCFKQMINGISYLHSMGVAHRDIKPENLLINEHGLLKITDFGVSDVFKMVWETTAHKSKGLCGSEPYIAPEQFITKEYDAREVDIWATAIVYYTMVHKGIPFRNAIVNEPNYQRYLDSREAMNYPPFKKYSEGCQELMYRIMEPEPEKRVTIKDIEENDWFKNIKVCTDSVSGSCFHQHFSINYIPKNLT